MARLKEFLEEQQVAPAGEPQKKVAGVTKQMVGLSRVQDWEKLPESVKAFYKQYIIAGGAQKNIFNFMERVVNLLTQRKLTGRHVAAWEKRALGIK